VIISPMILVGISKRRALLIGSATGLVEVIERLSVILVLQFQRNTAFALAFAGGTMLYVISDEMIPDTHSHGYERLATYSLLIGFTVMLVLDMFIG